MRDITGIGTDLYGQPVIMPLNPATTLPPQPVIMPLNPATTLPPQPVVFTFDPELGTFTLTGTVKERGTPNTPLRRKVVLVDEVSGRLVRETVSDALTGEYQFTNLRHSRYTVLSFDYTGHYRAVIADNLEPT